MIHSPFAIYENFISPKQCEDIIEKIRVVEPDRNKAGDPVPMSRFHDESEAMIYGKLRDKFKEFEDRYDAKYRGTDKMSFQYFPENAKVPAKEPGCESAKLLRKKWVKTKDVDLTAILWLKDFNDAVPLDPRYEVYGGKLEFPAFNFSLVPQRGTLIVYPAGPHFITAISPILVGDLYQVKIDIALNSKDDSFWFYNPAKFPCGKEGFINGWFKEFL